MQARDRNKMHKDQPKGIYDDDTLRIAVPKIVELAREFEHRGFDIVNISCAGDPGLEECHSELGIPVIAQVPRVSIDMALAIELV